MGAALAVLIAKRQGGIKRVVQGLHFTPATSPLPTVTCHHGAAGNGPLALAAAKSCAGHAEPAAGLLGLGATALALECRTLPRVLHLRWVGFPPPCAGMGAHVHAYLHPLTPDVACSWCSGL